LVAFANGNGGICLFGIEDAVGEKGRHIGKGIGIEISDRTRGQIQSRADETFDKVNIAIETETDENGKGIYVITIKEGQNKPYCTGGGRYLVRRDGQNCPITPTMMEEYIAPRIQNVPSAKKQLLLEEMRGLKDVLQAGLSDARQYYPPYYTKSNFGWIRDDRIDDVIANLTVDDKQLIQACNDFVEIAKIFTSEWFQSVKRMKQADPLWGPLPKKITEDFLKTGGGEYKNKLEELYRIIASRINSILS